MERIDDIVKAWKGEAGLSRKDIILLSAFPNSRETLKIYTGKPGYMIGKGGCLYQKYKQIILEKYQNIKEIELVETDCWYIR